MSTSQFAFLEAEFSTEFAMALKVEEYALTDPAAAVIYARKALESGVKWVYQYDRALPPPYEDKLNTYLNEPAFKALANGRVFDVAKKIQRAGNRAVHESKPPTKLEAVEVTSALFQFCFWLAYTYGRHTKPDPSIRFDPLNLQAKLTAEKSSLAQRKELEAQGIKVVDLEDDFKGVPNTYRVSDGHWTELGTEIAAKRLAAALGKMREAR